MNWKCCCISNSILRLYLSLYIVMKMCLVKCLFLMSILYQNGFAILTGNELRERSGRCTKDIMLEKYNVLGKGINQRPTAMKADIDKIIKECIIDVYDFKMSEPDNDNVIKSFTHLPTFMEEDTTSVNMYKTYFERMGRFMEFVFLELGADWPKIRGSFKNEQNVLDCERLLYLTGGRHLYYTYVLAVNWNGRVGDGEELQMCNSLENGYTELPARVCLPKRAGSMECTSDADLGLVGKDSGKLVNMFNQYFKKHFKNTSETVMDTNVYGLSFEFAVPQLYRPSEDYETFKERLRKYENSLGGQLTDIAFALFHARKYEFISHFSISGTKHIISEIEKRKREIENTEEYKNEIYGKFISGIDDKFRKVFSAKKLLFDIRMSLLLAEGAYYSFGSLRTVVFAGQMKKKIMINLLTLNDYWATIIENYGMAMHYMKCNNYKTCLIAASKYLWRTFSCMEAAGDLVVSSYENRGVRLILTATRKNSIKQFRDLFKTLLYDFKKKNIDNVPNGFPIPCTDLSDCKKEMSINLQYLSAIIYDTKDYNFVDEKINEDYFNYVTQP